MDGVTVGRPGGVFGNRSEIGGVPQTSSKEDSMEERDKMGTEEVMDNRVVVMYDPPPEGSTK